MRIIGNDPNTPRQTQVVASGTLSTGDTVVVNSDGTVSAVEGQSSVAGSPVTYEAANININAATFDSNSNKVVIVYRDGGNSNYGTAIVGTVSGTSISFGTPVVFSSSVTSDHAVTFDSTNNKVVITYQDVSNSSYGTAIVGTISGTSISFGSASVFNSGTTTYTSLTFDTNLSKIVVAYRDNSNSNYGTAIVGTVSGTSISFGTEVVFNSGITNYTSAVFDSSNNKVVIGYQDASNSSYGTAVVGTVSGTSISFGSEVVFEDSRVDFVDSTFDSFSEKVIFAYKNEPNSNAGTAVVGTVSGTSVSFGTPVVFQASYSDYVQCVYDSNANKINIFFRDNTSPPSLTQTVGTVSGTSISFTTPAPLENVNASSIGATFDSNVNKVVVTYRDESNSYYGKAIVFQNESTNLTSENYIGTAKSGAADGDGVVVNTQGNVADIPAAPYDIAGASYDGVSFSVSSQDSDPYGLGFNNDGTKMYVSGNTNDSIYQYTLSTAFDLSTASYDSVSFSYASQELIATSVIFNNDGTKMYIVGQVNDNAYQYSLSTAFDLSTASYDSVSFSFASEDTSPYGIVFNSDGTKLYMVGIATDSIYQYSLSTAYDLSTASYDSVSFSVASEDINPTGGIVFNSDGTKMYMVGVSTDNVYQYSLSTAYDLSTASYDNVSFSVASEDGSPQQTIFNSDGTKMFILGNNTDTIYQYSTDGALTPAQSYYVQTDGTLSTTAGDPSVFAGTAVSSTKLIVKG